MAGLILAACIGGCSTSAGSGAGSPLTGSPSEGPTAPASQAVSPLPDGTPSIEPKEVSSSAPLEDRRLNVDQLAITLVNELRVRSEPMVGPSSARLEPLLPSGVRLLVIEEPVEADGYLWYHVIPMEPSYPSGWVAASSREGDSWIAADQTECPEVPLDASDLAALGPYGGLACYGSQEVEATGDLTCGLGDVDNSIAGPTWLSSDYVCFFEQDGAPSTFFHLDSIIIEFPTSGPHVLTGHFADPQAKVCVWAIDDPGPPRAEVTANCRALFVVTQMTAS